jgi:signal transduction histidine kinase
LADFSLLLGALKNIVRNGFTHNDSALKRIEVRVGPGTTNQRTRISIEDNGVGMPPEYLEKWGQTMGKAAQLNTGRGGSGTGLYSIRTVMNAHKDASIEITSTVGSGTTYILEFNHVA